MAKRRYTSGTIIRKLREAEVLRNWLEHMGSKTAYIMPGSPRGSRYCKSFNNRLLAELLNGGIFCTQKEDQVIIEHWQHHYNTGRPHSAPGYRPPAPEVVIPKEEKQSLETDQLAA